MKIPVTWEGVDQPPDERTAGDPWFLKTTYREFHEGLKTALARLKEWSSIAQELDLESSPYREELERLEQIISWGEERLKGGTESSLPHIMVKGVSYGSLRYLKAGLLLRVQDLDRKKQGLLAKGGSIPGSVLQTFDGKIEQLLNLAEQGLLNGLRPADLFFEAIEVIPDRIKSEGGTEKALKSETTGRSYALSDVPIVDSVLRERCLGLLSSFEEQERADQFDIVIREMSVILEDRVRELSGCGEELSGMELFAAAMAGASPRIRFSERRDLQEAAHLLFRGYVGFVRNEAMHKLVPSYTRGRTAQLLGMVDYLLFLLTKAGVPSK